MNKNVQKRIYGLPFVAATLFFIFPLIKGVGFSAGLFSIIALSIALQAITMVVSVSTITLLAKFKLLQAGDPRKRIFSFTSAAIFFATTVVLGLSSLIFPALLSFHGALPWLAASTILFLVQRVVGQAVDVLA